MVKCDKISKDVQDKLVIKYKQVKEFEYKYRIITNRNYTIKINMTI